MIMTDPFAAAIERGKQAKQRLLEAEGGMLTLEQLALQYPGPGEDIAMYIERDLLIYLKIDGRAAIPAWQFDANGAILSGLPAVMAALDAAPWMRMAFFLSPNSRLDGQTPLQRLRAGDTAAVLRAARVYSEHGAA